MSDISPSVIQTNAALKEQLKSAGNVEQIKEILRAEAVKQGHVVPDAFDNRILLPVEQPAAQNFAKSITVNGQKHILQADSEIGLAQAETALFKELISPNRPAETQPEAQRDERGRFVSADDAAAKVELELKFKRGDISAAAYLAESGAIDTYLQSKGVSLGELKAATTQKYTKSWENAVNDFKVKHPEYIGDASTLAEFQRVLTSLDLVEKPSVESLEAAYADIVHRGANHAANAHAKISEATSTEEIRTACHALFGR